MPRPALQGSNRISVALFFFEHELNELNELGTMTDEYKKGYEQGQLDLLEKLMHTEWTYIFDVIGEQYKRLTHDRLSERTTQ